VPSLVLKILACWPLLPHSLSLVVRARWKPSPRPTNRLCSNVARYLLLRRTYYFLDADAVDMRTHQVQEKAHVNALRRSLPAIIPTQASRGRTCLLQEYKGSALACMTPPPQEWIVDCLARITSTSVPGRAMPSDRQSARAPPSGL